MTIRVIRDPNNCSRYFTWNIFREHGKAHKIAYNQMTIRDRYRDIRHIDWEAEKRIYRLGIVLF